LKRVYLSLGTNLGDREASLREALAQLGAAGIRILRVSSLYETEPRDVPDQPWFLNAVVEAETKLFPKMLLARTQGIEQAMGRKKTRPKGPRTIDTDILLYGNSVIDTETLVIPHPRMHERRFVLEPLAELAPELRHPATRRTVREMLAGVQDQGVRRLGEFAFGEGEPAQ
jgi:2-amino-4-hydroxy-6-hydroxymethyldihydropteridine diphosphokinase